MLLLQRMLKIASRTALLVSLAAGLMSPATAQNWSMWQGSEGGVQVRARLRDKEQNARQHLAAVEVEVQNVWLHYPAPVPQDGIQVAVLEYRLDSCPPVLTTDTRLRFDQLAPGVHRVRVALLGANDSSPISPVVTLEVNIP